MDWFHGPRSKRLLLAFGLFFLVHSEAEGRRSARLHGHVPKLAGKARHLGRHARKAKLKLALTLEPKNPEALNKFVERLYDPQDPIFRQFLSPEEFRARFAPSEEEINQISSYLSSRGIRVTSVHKNNLVMNIEADTSSVEDTFEVEIQDYITQDGRQAYAPTTDPALSEKLIGRVRAIAGLNNFSRLRTHRLKTLRRLDPHDLSPHASIGSYMTPAKIRNAYGFGSAPNNGTGEIVALFQLDGYNASDITAYANQFSLNVPTLQNVLVDGFDGSAGDDSSEVVLDISLVMAAANGISKIMIYEGPNTETGVINTYSRIANDNIAKSVSSSWGAPEDDASASYRSAENVIFQQMAAQGQSIFVASGDNGAYDDPDRPNVLEVDDPASQPYVTAVGGTSLKLTAANAYDFETSWGSNSMGGGGGISSQWNLPSYQAGLATSANKGSSSKRMVPDVALDSNPSTGYPIYWKGSWYVFGGTSAAAPLWAAFSAVVNQQRVANGLPRLGFANPSLYQIAQSSLYASAFNDVADNSTNLYYPAVTGYDLSTGLGSFKGSGLLAALTSGVLPPYPATNLSTLPQSGAVQITWAASSGATSYTIFRSTSASGPFASVATNVVGTSFGDAVPNGYYYYYIVANNSAGSSARSVIVNGTPDVTAPNAPTSLTITVLP